MTLAALSLASLLASFEAGAPTAPQRTFDLKEVNSGILALESVVVSQTLAIFFDRVTNDPLQINSHSAWGALWNLESNNVTALDVITNSFCAGGAMLSNGTMVGHCHSCLSLSANYYISGEHRGGRKGL